MLTFYFTGVEGKMTVPELLTSGMMGKELRLEFSEEWESLSKTVVFSNGETTLDRLYTGETMVIPAQILEKPLEQLTVGLYGVSEDGLLVIPTIRAKGPMILPGVDPSGDPGVDPSLPVWAQLREMVEQMEDLVEEEKTKLVEAMDALARRVDKSPAAAYYGSLAAAISDVNNGIADNALTAREGAKVSVFTAHTGAKTVMLLDNVSESTGITVNKDIDLVLNGKTLNLTTAASVLTFGAGTKCRIYGEVPGSAIVMDGANISANTVMITTNGDFFQLHGGNYTMKVGGSYRTTLFLAGATSGRCEIYDAVMSITNTTDGQVRVIQSQATKGMLVQNVSGEGYTNGQANGLFLGGNIDARNSVIRLRSVKGGVCTANILGGCKLSLKDCKMYATCTNGWSDCGEVREGAMLYAENTLFFADATDCHVKSPDLSAVGLKVLAGGEAHLTNCEVVGTHSGVSARGNLYANGGIYKGFCHGGVYVTGGGNHFINDITSQCGNYEGEFDYSGKTEEIYGSMYIGGSAEANDLTAYLDGCTIANANGNAIVMRGTDGEHDNTVYISNSTVLGTIRIDNDTLKMYVGAGTNIETYKIDNPARAEFTRKLYRKNSGEKMLDGSDYDALAAWMDEAAGLVKSVGGIQADKNGNVPLAWVATDDFQSVVILEESAVSGGFTSAFGYDDLYGQEELAVLCDGRLYLCVPEFGYSESDGYYVYLGNQSLLSESQADTGEPFLAWGYKGTRLILSFRESGSHTMSVTGYRYGYTKLPAKYLPEDAIREIVEAVLAEKQN